MGDTLAKLSVSAPVVRLYSHRSISAVTPDSTSRLRGGSWHYLKILHFNQKLFCGMFGILAILSTSGGRTSREFMSLATSFWIMKVTTIMVIILIAWCVVTVFKTVHICRFAPDLKT